MTENEKKHLSEVIDYDTDIAPYQFIKIYAGIGSGKNTFIDNLVRGGRFTHKDGSLVEKQSILLVTSRRAKADEQRNLEDVSYDMRVGMYDHFDDPFYYFDDDEDLDLFMSPQISLTDDMGEKLTVRLRSCCCTNAQIEKLWQKYLPQATQTHPWERFDMIVIDEVHAILADASYQSSPFYVRRLIEETLSKSSKCKVIVMTGSQEILDSYPLFNDAHCLNFMDCCINLMPKKVVFQDSTQASYKIRELLAAGNKAVYFSNTIKNISSLVNQLGEYNDNIAVSFSDKEKRSRLRSENPSLYGRMESTEKCLAGRKRIPDTIYLFLSTAKNKEGINIENPDIKTMFIESHAEQDIKQMVGRLRNGVETLYIVTDPKMFSDSELEGEQSFSLESDLLDTVNKHYRKLCIEAEYSWAIDDLVLTQMEITALANFILFIHEKFPYIRFDFATNTFVQYPERKKGRAYYETQNALFQSNKTVEGLVTLAGTWFPESRCEVTTPFLDNVHQELRKFLLDRSWLGFPVKNENREEILKEICRLTGTRQKQLKRGLNKLGFDMKESSHNILYGKFTITEINGQHN